MSNNYKYRIRFLEGIPEYETLGPKTPRELNNKLHIIRMPVPLNIGEKLSSLPGGEWEVVDILHEFATVDGNDQYPEWQNPVIHDYDEYGSLVKVKRSQWTSIVRGGDNDDE